MNNLEPGHQTKEIYFPDINPSDLPENSQFSMAAGDFLEVFFVMYAHNEVSRKLKASFTFTLSSSKI